MSIMSENMYGLYEWAPNSRIDMIDTNGLSIVKNSPIMSWNFNNLFFAKYFFSDFDVPLIFYSELEIIVAN